MIFDSKTFEQGPERILDLVCDKLKIKQQEIDDVRWSSVSGLVGVASGSWLLVMSFVAIVALFSDVNFL